MALSLLYLVLTKGTQAKPGKQSGVDALTSGVANLVRAVVSATADPFNPKSWTAGATQQPAVQSAADQQQNAADLAQATAATKQAVAATNQTVAATQAARPVVNPRAGRTINGTPHATPTVR